MENFNGSNDLCIGFDITGKGEKSDDDDGNMVVDYYEDLIVHLNDNQNIMKWVWYTW